MKLENTSPIIGTFLIRGDEDVRSWNKIKRNIDTQLERFKLQHIDDLKIDEKATVLDDGSLKLSATIADGKIELVSLCVESKNWARLH